MKQTRMKILGLSLAAAAALLASATGQAQTFITDSYTNSFDLGGNTADFSGSGSVASWIRWYDYGGNITCKYGLDANDQTNTSGCLQIDSPFGAGGNQNVFFGTFGNQGGYDFSKRINMVNYTNITFDVMMAPGTQPRTNNAGDPLDFGSINVGIINANYGFQGMGNVTIPLAASNSWVHLSRLVDVTQNNLANVPGIAMQYANYGGYPRFPVTFYLDNLVVKLSPVPTPPPTLSGKLEKPVAGLNAIDVSALNQYDRDQVVTVNSSGYSFVGQPSVTYTWNIAAFPAGTGGNYQQHLFIVNGAPGPYDQAADYNLAQCIFITVQQADNGVATMNFRYKTNQPAGNAMLFNGTDPTNTVDNPNGWPIMPVARVTSASGAVGTWSVTFADTTNVTLTGPSGSTNFVMDADSAALFADPASLILGGQANNTNGVGRAVVYGSFSATGCATPISENFATESSLDTNVWKNFSNDPNGIALVPPDSAYWLSWSLPDGGFSLQDAATVNAAPASWVDLSPVTSLLNAGKRQVLIPSSTLPSVNAGFYRLIQRTFSQLQVLFPGETNAPNTVSGKGGTPDTITAGDTISVTVNAVDSTFHIIPGIVDNIHITSTDGAAIIGLDANLVNSTRAYLIQLNTTGTNTVSATDLTDVTIPTAVSTPVNVQ